MKLMKKRPKRSHVSLCILHKRPFKIFSLVLAFILVLSCLCACEIENGAITETEPTTEAYSLPRQSIKIGYSSTDSLNPFLAKTTLNTSQAALVYQSLYTLDSSFTPMPEIASFSDYDQTRLVVYMNKDLLFSDGSNISSQDVAYSFNTAKQSELFKNKLENFESVETTGVYELSFTLLKNDPYCLNLLDFPVVKNNSAESAEAFPTGSGLYMYQKNSEGIQLLHNRYCTAARPEIGTIELVDIEDSSTLAYSLETGIIDAYYTDLNTSRLSRTYASTATVHLNNFVYLGINNSNYALSFAQLRRAISLCTNRTDICGTAYQGRAAAAYTLFNPNWSVFASSAIDTSGFAVDYSEGIKMLEEMGYTSLSAGGTRSGSMGTLSFRLIINSGNEYKLFAAKQIAASLKKAGININVVELSWENYITALANSDYDLYLGEIKLPSNMDMSALFTPSGSASYGINMGGKTAAAFNEYSSGTLSLEAFNTEFQANMPLIPLCYRDGLLIVKRDITGKIESSAGNIYSSISGWRIYSTQQETTTQATTHDIVL